MFGSKDNDQVAHSLRDVSKKTLKPSEITKQKRIEAIKRLIVENPDQILTIEDFKNAAGATTAIYYLKELMKDGYAVRHQASTGLKGHQYTYTWEDEPNPTEDLESQSVDDNTLMSIKKFLMEWQGLNAEDDDVDDAARGLQQLGATKFVKWVSENKLKPVNH